MVNLEIIVCNDLIGSILKKRYMVGNQLDEGSFGCIYDCVDLTDTKKNLVIKVSTNYQMLGREIQALKDIKSNEMFDKFEYPYEYVPEIIAKGMFISELPEGAGNHDEPNSDDSYDLRDTKQLMSYYVMEKYGKNLESMFTQFDQKFSDKTNL